MVVGLTAFVVHEVSICVYNYYFGPSVVDLNGAWRWLSPNNIYYHIKHRNAAYLYVWLVQHCKLNVAVLSVVFHRSFKS